MVMSFIFTGLLAVSLIAALISGNGSQVAAAIPQGAQSGVTVAISIAGSICLWTGVGNLMDKAGFTSKLTKLLQPILHKLFPSSRLDKPLANSLSTNICANILGLGNAATPMGIQAAKQLAAKSGTGVASHELCRLIILNWN